MGLIIVLVKKFWVYAYSNEGEVVNYVDMMMPILAIADILDGIQCVLSGTDISYHYHLITKTNYFF